VSLARPGVLALNRTALAKAGDTDNTALIHIND
jgi:hypothetical protein